VFRSDSDEGWFPIIYGRKQATRRMQSGLQQGEACFEFHPGDSRDHLATQYLELPPESARLFFSVWAKPEQPEDSLSFSIQDESHGYVAHASPVLRRPDGWILFAGLFNAPKGKIRAVIQENIGTRFLLEKGLIVSLPASSGKPAKADVPAKDNLRRGKRQQPAGLRKTLSTGMNLHFCAAGA
jgi:hypothetical protein